MKLLLTPLVERVRGDPTRDRMQIIPFYTRGQDWVRGFEESGFFFLYFNIPSLLHARLAANFRKERIFAVAQQSSATRELA